MSRTRLTAIFLLLSLILAACQLSAPPAPAAPTPADTPAAGGPPDAPAPSPQPLTGLAIVDSVEILLLESFPVQVQAVARGNLPDGCTTLVEPVVSREGDTFSVTLATSRPADAVCTLALVPFEKAIAIEAVGLPKGAYTVNVNGVLAVFEFQVDNAAPETASGSLTGLVWHDLCAVSGGEGAPVTPGPGCVAAAGGGFAANGALDEGETGISSVTVTLQAGPCSQGGEVRTAVTDAAGNFRFDALAAGTYCVQVDAAAAANSSLLPGAWTSPADGSGKMEVTLAAGEARTGVNFGWDYQLLPAPQNAANCTNLASFVADVTIPDDTATPAGTKFTKTWRLRNDGTCTWTAGYAVVFSKGEQMGGASPTPLGQTVAPGATADVSVEMTAPAAAGNYRGDWTLQSDQNVKFGLGADGAGTFYVKIIVTQGASVSDLNLGAASWTDTFNNGSGWYLLNTANVKWEVSDGALKMTAKNAGGFEEWGLANRPKIKNFYIEGAFRTGACSGLDRYGYVLRAPEPNKGIVFNFSCDGRYRVYKWDGSKYIAIQEWKANSAIKTGGEKTNKIGVWFKNDKIKIYANGQLIAELTDSTYNDKGSFGLLIGSVNTDNLKIFVEEISVWDLGE